MPGLRRNESRQAWIEQMESGIEGKASHDGEGTWSSTGRRVHTVYWMCHGATIASQHEATRGCGGEADHHLVHHSAALVRAFLESTAASGHGRVI
jgi:hypothetical protein